MPEITKSSVTVSKVAVTSQPTQSKVNVQVSLSPPEPVTKCSMPSRRRPYSGGASVPSG